MNAAPAAKPTVSAFIVCLNEEKQIRRCLESVKWCDEIVVVDSGSTDNTLAICREYTDRIFQRPRPGHSEQKQFALEQCRCDWVLNIDSDEEVSMELRGEILGVLSRKASDRDRTQGYDICRLIHFLDRWWDHGGWYPEYRLRFFQRKSTRWGGVNPHEKALVSGKITKLRGVIYHHTYTSLHHQVECLNRHSTNMAKALSRAEVPYRANLPRILFHAVGRFVKFYFLKRGFKEGAPGFIVACVEAGYTFLKYAKLWEIQKFGEPVPSEPESLFKLDLHAPED